jgi:hypothetical protein
MTACDLKLLLLLLLLFVSDAIKCNTEEDSFQLYMC